MKLVEKIEDSLGVHRIYKASNGYGASVISYGQGSEHGLLELAVIRFNSVGTKFKLVYDTPITGDVVGHLTEGQVQELLKRIEKLNRWQKLLNWIGLKK